MRAGSHPWAHSWAQKALNITGDRKTLWWFSSPFTSWGDQVISSPVSSWRPLLLLWPSSLGLGGPGESATLVFFCFFFSHWYQFSVFCFLWVLSFCTNYRLDRSEVHIPHDQVSESLVPTQHGQPLRPATSQATVPAPATVLGSGPISDPFHCSPVLGPWVTKDSQRRLQKGFSANSFHH